MLGKEIVNYGGIEKPLNQFMAEFGCEINARNIARIRSRIKIGVDESKWFSGLRINSPSSYLMYQSSENQHGPLISLTARVERDYPKHDFNLNTLYAFIKRRINKNQSLNSPSELEVLVTTWVHKQSKEEASPPTRRKGNYRERTLEYKGEMLTLKEILLILKIPYEPNARQKYLSRIDRYGCSVDEAFDPGFKRRKKRTADQSTGINKISIPEPGNFELVPNEPSLLREKSVKISKGHPVFFDGVLYESKYSLWNSNRSRAAVGYSAFLSNLSQFHVESITDNQILYCLGVIDSWEKGYYFTSEDGLIIPTRAEFLRAVGIGIKTLNGRLNNGWTLSEIYINKEISGCESNGVLNAKMARKNPNLPVSIYLAWLEVDQKNNIFKIGLTTKDFDQRFNAIRKKFPVTKILIVPGILATLFDLEQKFKNTIFAHKKYIPTIKFEGKTECYQLTAQDLEGAKTLMIQSGS